MSRPLRLFAGPLCVLAVAAPTVAFARSAAAENGVSAPTVALDHYEFKVGDQVNLFVRGFLSNSVVVAICGNEARRGSGDCNMASSLARDLRAGESEVRFAASAPPVPCPCLIRVSSPNNDEVAIAPVTLIGHPTAPIVDSVGSTQKALAVNVIAQTVPGGLIDSVRSGLGGATTYEITVTVKNTSSAEIDNVHIDGAVGRDAQDVITSLLLSPPGSLAPGETWRQTVRAKLGAPVYGKFQWRVSVASDAPTVTAVDETKHQPVLLFILLIVFVVDLSALAWRFLGRRNRLKLNGEHERGDFDDGVDDEVGGRIYHLVGQY